MFVFIKLLVILHLCFCDNIFTKFLRLNKVLFVRFSKFVNYHFEHNYDNTFVFPLLRLKKHKLTEYDDFEQLGKIFSQYNIKLLITTGVSIYRGFVLTKETL